jgi:hypothetical protein
LIHLDAELHLLERIKIFALIGLDLSVTLRAAIITGTGPFIFPLGPAFGALVMIPESDGFVGLGHGITPLVWGSGYFLFDILVDGHIKAMIDIDIDGGLQGVTGIVLPDPIKKLMEYGLINRFGHVVSKDILYHALEISGFEMLLGY